MYRKDRLRLGLQSGKELENTKFCLMGYTYLNACTCICIYLQGFRRPYNYFELLNSQKAEDFV